MKDYIYRRLLKILMKDPRYYQKILGENVYSGELYLDSDTAALGIRFTESLVTIANKESVILKVDSASFSELFEAEKSGL